MLPKVVLFLVGLHTALGQNIGVRTDSGLDLANLNPDTNLGVGGASIPCYDEQGLAQRCQPPFVNAAYGKVIKATNTCGMDRETEFCLQTGKTGSTKYCNTCDNNNRMRRHPPEFMTDFNDNTRYTWWQSETMLEGIQYPTVVNITVFLGKSFDITYVNLRFFSPRPESFAIFKRSKEGGPWEPFQFYSGSCRRTYGLPTQYTPNVTREDEAVCTSRYSNISPLTGASVAFSSLDGRPNNQYFNQNEKLQEWVTATDIRVVLTRMNTFGDEVFGDPKVLKSYFYAITDLAIGARCKCNGHAKKCVKVRGQDLTERLRCECEHNTMGVDCEQCLPFYNDQPWGRATESNAHECKQCDCNGHSNTCEFDPVLYRQTGHGGRCTNCRGNTAGVHCELCQENFWRRNNQCVDCQCDPTGSVSLQCDDMGKCRCKPGVGGERCDRCLPNYFDFGQDGCAPCECNMPGSLNNEPKCDSSTGRCMCKENVDGRRCDECKPGYFSLSEDDPYGCISCFCYGHSTTCFSARDYYGRNITTDFSTGPERWTAVTRSNRDIPTQYDGVSQHLGVSSDGEGEYIFFSAPGIYLGDQRFSYGQYLRFDHRIGEDQGSPSRTDIVLEGGTGQSVSIHIFAQQNRVPTVRTQSFKFRIHEHSEYQWYPTVNAVDLISILSNLTALKIRAVYNKEGVGFIDNIQLETAHLRSVAAGQPQARWVEQCTCPEGFIGQFCESCQQGYKRDRPNGGPFSRCVPCQCNNHSDSCDVRTGKCICKHNTAGEYCERCERGYYGDATVGTPDDCKACPCPNGGPCMQMLNGDVVCTECDEGYGGNLCDVCLDGYYGDPTGAATGTPTPCKKCTCSGNIDPNAVHNCDTVTGECLKCIGNTGGFLCEQCLPNYYNNSMGQCQACNCNPAGTIVQPGQGGCDQRTGQCLCLPNVIGQHCGSCAQGYWDIASGQGCRPCECDQTGSRNYTCDERSGDCDCKDGVTGRQCDACARLYYGFSSVGCTACNCDPVGSTDLDCDANGYCACRDNVDGRRCDRCMENKYDISAGCLDCPQCYNLVQRQVNMHRAKLRELTNLIDKTTDNPSLFNDTKFISYLQNVNDTVNELLQDARGAYTGDGKVGQELDALRQTLMDLMNKLDVIARNIKKAAQASADSQADIASAEAALMRAEQAYQAAKDYIDKEGRMALSQALDALKNFGQGSKQMTEIAKKAASLADKQTKDAQMIEDLAKKALDTSREANRLANEAFRMPDTTKADIARLEREFDDASSLYQTTRSHANMTYKRVTEAFEEAVDLLAQAERQLPSLDVDGLRDQAQEVKDKAEDIKNKAAELAKNNEDLMAKVQNQTAQANSLLGDGDLLNANITDLLAEADYARDVARKAVESARKTLQEANDTLRTLQEFDQLVSKKDAAEQAMDQVPEIKQIIADARDTTQMARDALQGVEADAERALKLAVEAEATAKMASEDAGKIRAEAEKTKMKADMLKDDAEGLKQDVEMADLTLDNFAVQVSQDEDSAKQALNAAAEARNKAKKAFDEVNKSHALVKKIKDSLKDVGSVDKDELQRLQDLLDQVEKDLQASDIENKVRELQQRKAQIESQADKFDMDLTELRKDVKNIQEIRDSLPDDCFKSIPIEFKPV